MHLHLQKYIQTEKTKSFAQAVYNMHDGKNTEPTFRHDSGRSKKKSKGFMDNNERDPGILVVLKEVCKVYRGENDSQCEAADRSNQSQRK